MNAGVTIGNWTAAERCDQGPIPPLVMAELDPAIQPNRPSARTVFLDPRVEPGGDERRACAGLSASSIGRRPLVEPDAIPAVAVVTRPPSLPSSWPGSTRPSSRTVQARGRSFWTPGSSPGATRGERVRRLSASSIGTRPLVEPDAIPPVTVVTRPPSLPSSWPGSTRPSSRAVRARGRSFWAPGSSPGPTRGERVRRLSASSIGTRPLAEPDAIPAVAVVTRPPSLPSSWPGSTRPSSRTGRARGRSLCPPSPGSTPATTRAETAPHLSIVPDRHPGFIAGVQQPRPLNAPRTANGPHP